MSSSPIAPTTTPTTGELRVDLFCRVIDNWGDLGVCWRLARQLRNEFGAAVQLIVDDLAPFSALEPRIDGAASRQRVDGIVVQRWQAFAPICRADWVIEAFACDPPTAYVESMCTRPSLPFWINLEYLSAEAWVDGVHGLPSPHPRLPLTKYFFVPGFSDKSGGLIRELDVSARATAGTTIQDAAHKPCRIFSFTYPHAPVHALARGFAYARLDVQLELASPLKDALPTWTVLAPVAQTAFDARLAQYDLLLVRGEDSFVRAQLLGKPLLWHIYPTDDQAHMVKLDAWLDRYCAGMGAELEAVYRNACHAFVQPELADKAADTFRVFALHLAALRMHALGWQKALCDAPDLLSRLVTFVQSKGGVKPIRFFTQENALK
jgi:hypothetical protein